MSDEPSEHPAYRETLLAKLRHGAEIVALLAAGAWGIFVFVYQQHIEPSLENPSEQMTVSWDPGHAVRGVRVAELRVELFNTGRTDTDVVAEAIDVYGLRFETTHASTPPASTSPDRHDDDRTVPLSKPELLLARGRLRDAARSGRLGTHIILAAGQRTTLVYPVAVRSGRYDELRSYVQVVYARSDLGRHGYADVTIVPRSVGGVQLEVDAPDAIEEEDDQVDLTL